MFQEILRFRDFWAVAGFQSALVTFLVWLEVGRDFGWRDAALAICAGLGIATAMALFVRYARYLRNSGRPPLRLPSKRIPRLLAAFALNSLLFVIIYSIPVTDGRLFHPLNPNKHTLTWLVGYSAWMGLWFAVAFGRKNASAPEVCSGPSSGAAGL